MDPLGIELDLLAVPERIIISVTLVLGGVTSPVKNFFIGAIPEFIRSKDLSLLGTKEKLGNLKCPLDSKKLRYFSLKSFKDVHFIGQIPFKINISKINTYILTLTIIFVKNKYINLTKTPINSIIKSCKTKTKRS